VRIFVRKQVKIVKKKRMEMNSKVLKNSGKIMMQDMDMELPL